MGKFSNAAKREDSTGRVALKGSIAMQNEAMDLAVRFYRHMIQSCGDVFGSAKCEEDGMKQFDTLAK